MAVGPASTPDPASTTPQPASTPDPASSADSASEVSRIKKGVTMRVTVYIEGEDAPAHETIVPASATARSVASSTVSAVPLWDAGCLMSSTMRGCR